MTGVGSTVGSFDRRRSRPPVVWYLLLPHAMSAEPVHLPEAECLHDKVEDAEVGCQHEGAPEQADHHRRQHDGIGTHAHRARDAALAAGLPFVHLSAASWRRGIVGNYRAKDREIATVIKDYKVIVDKSTVPVKTGVSNGRVTEVPLVAQPAAGR